MTYESVARYMRRLQKAQPMMDAETMRMAPYNWQIEIDQKLVDRWIEKKFRPDKQTTLTAADLARIRMIHAKARMLVAAKQWDESKHPRDDDGKFSETEEGGGGGGKSSDVKSDDDTKPPQKKMFVSM